MCVLFQHLEETHRRTIGNQQFIFTAAEHWDRTS